ncbi:hypothetical protein IAI18_17230 [Acetobacteraceae bacterium H6797]|nr:hypothetical protein [Acetobacteraceae bacterium H6797]
MNRQERLIAAMTGGTPDRVPVSAWGHWYDREVSAEKFADVMLEFQEAYDWDFVKLHARASYHVEGFGFRYEPSTDPAALHKTLATPIKEPGDWRKLRPLTLEDPGLAEQLHAIRLIRKRVGPEVPMIMTVFLPLDVADKLVDRDGALLKAHIEADEDAVAAGLATFAETFIPFVKAVVAEGVEGIYFSTKWANKHRIPVETYNRLARPFDLAVIEAGKSLPCNLMHMCEDGVYMEALADYPVPCFHWETQTPGNPSPAKALGILPPGRAVGGGVDPRTLAYGTPAEVRMKARDAVRQTNGRHFLLGPGCSILTAKTPRENLMALRKAAEG